MFEGIKALWGARQSRSISSLFEADPSRAERFTRSAAGLRFDFSKTQLDDELLSALIELAEQRELERWRDQMMSGALINDTEGRAVLHTALRSQRSAPLLVDGVDVRPEVQATLKRMERFADSVRSGDFKGQGGQISDVINIGIGGSDLGPAMATLALSPYHDGPRVHFVSNVDGAHLHDTLKGLNPETTLLIIASKTFTTIETMTNAHSARAWLAERVEQPSAQCVALSSSLERSADFGIDPSRVFGFADWVGGRYSLWGPIGLSLMIAIGPERFRELLEGAAALDEHFCEAPLAENLPVLLALVGLWHQQGCGMSSRAVLPYDQRLARLPAYLQQLEMESNGKGVSRDGASLPYPSGPIVWGEAGTNGQHAFYQLIHQGTSVIPCEFLVAARGHEPALARHHRLLVANCLAQSEALMVGRSLDEALALMRARGYEGEELLRQARHRVFEGSRPSTTLIYPQLSPKVLGAIIALYEHRVFVEGVILGINSYDQWGVELGKALAQGLEPMVAGRESCEGKDSSTQALISYVRRYNS